MGLTTAMYTGLTGLNVNQTRVETIGNNIANVNTHAFKSSRTLFQTQFYRTMSLGTAPGDTSGGTNPMQVGLGALVATTQRTISPGSVETTGLNGDMAVDGNGYFVVRDPAGREYYTRDGSFTLNSKHELVDVNGNRVRGFAADATGAIVPGTLQDLIVPLGTQSVARATQNVVMDGDLSAASLRAVSGSETRTQNLVNGGGAAADAATGLTDLRTATNSTIPLFSAGDTITITGVSKGERELTARQFVVGQDGNTLGDFANWLQDTLGIQTTTGVPGTPGVAIENGQLVVRSNAGSPLAISLDSADVRSTNAGSGIPFQFTQTASAIGSGVTTSFRVYDSLGNAVPVIATFTLEGTPDTGPVWRYYLESAESGQPNQLLGTGLVSFDPEGNMTNATGNQFTISRTGTGAATPITFTMDMSALNGLATSESAVVMALQDGYPAGTLVDWGVGKDGTITGVFSNGLSATIGQVALATFANDSGLVAESHNLFSVGANSGPAEVKSPGTLGAGTIQPQSLEMSNVDLSSEFIGLITSSTAFQAASRVISTSSDMLDQLMMALR